MSLVQYARYKPPPLASHVGNTPFTQEGINLARGLNACPPRGDKAKSLKFGW